MNESEQQILFKRVQKRFRKWSKRKCSGYVHGIMDEKLLVDPSSAILGGDKDKYYYGYLYGFIDARGPDVLDGRWYRKLRIRPTAPKYTREQDYRWWVKK